MMNWQAIKELITELFHNLSLGSLYRQDPELRPIPVETRRELPPR
ncbi:MAG: hypothetical protein R3208_11005 [Ketobacteraceae bacterium]|nr:hypothetical protein [Ketobacteraceae bacterium]